MTTFLVQYWGGPGDYSEQRGHPRLRMRHAAFRMDTETRDRWLHHMRDAVEDLCLDPDHQARLWEYLRRAACSLTAANAWPGAQLYGQGPAGRSGP